MKHKAVFLDRDNTLIEDPGYINQPNQVTLLPGTAASLAQLRKMGFLLIVISNQSGVARGLVTEEILTQIHHQLEKLLANENVYLDAIYYCPYHPDGTVAKYKMESNMRKPAPGMILKAAGDLNIDLSQSWMVGDSYRDVEAGQRAGCRTILIDNPAKPAIKNPCDPEPDRKAVNIREATNIIRMLQRRRDAEPSAEATSPEPQAETAHPSQTTSEINTSAKPPVKIETPLSVSQTLPISKSIAVSPSPQIQPQPLPPAEQTDGPVSEPQAPVENAFKPISQKTDPTKTEALMNEVLTHLKIAYKLGQDDDFSIWMLAAGMAQILAVGCIVVSLWFLLDSTHSNGSAMTALAYAAVLQLGAIAVYLMNSKR